MKNIFFKRISFLIFGLLLFWNITLEAKQTKKDSLLHLLQTNIHDTFKVEVQLSLGRIYSNENPDSSFLILQQAVDLSKKVNYAQGLAGAYYNLSYSYYNTGKYSKTILYANKALEICKDFKDKTRAGECYNMLGNTYADLKDYDNAIKAYMKASDIFEKQNYQPGLVRVLGNMGVLYSDLHDYDKALKYLFRSMKIDSSLKDYQSLTGNILNTGVIYLDQKNYEKAIWYFEKGLEMGEKTKYARWTSFGFANLGDTYFELGDFKKAQSFYNKALLLYDKTGNDFGKIEAWRSIGKIYIRQKNYPMAIEYINKSLKLGTDLEITLDMVENYKYLYEIYKAKGDPAMALLYHEKFKELSDSVATEEAGEETETLKTIYHSDQQEKEIQLLNKEKALKEAIISKQENQRLYFIGITILSIIALSVLIFAFRNKQQSNKLLQKKKEEIEHKNEELNQQNEEIAAQRDEIEKQKQAIEVVNKDITDSIRYAKRIQNAVLPPDELVKQMLPDSFVYFKPKEILSGDFYWVDEKNDRVYFAAVDCTGHGVPGAFLSIMGFNLLKHAIHEHNKIHPGEILDQLNKDITETLRQKFSDTSVRDGMDISLCALNKKTGELEYAGANNSIYVVNTKNELAEITANKQPIGLYMDDTPPSFTTHKVNAEKGSMVYLFSDGYADQFGGEKGKKFKYKSFENMLNKIAALECKEQMGRVAEEFLIWKGNYEQIDDVLVIGVRL